MDYALESTLTFIQYSIHRDIPVDVDALRGVLVHVISTGGLFVDVDGGVLVAALAPLVFNPTVLVASELAWWSPGGHGKELRAMFEQWGRDQGASKLHLTALADDRFEKVNNNMIRNGYKLTEFAYIKDI